MEIVNKVSEKIIKFPMVFFLVASAVQYRKIIFEGKKIGWDTLDAIFPHFLYMVDCFKNGTFPYYNPLIMGGFSFGENYFTAFLLNPLDVFIAMLATVISPLYIFVVFTKKLPLYLPYSNPLLFLFIISCFSSKHITNSRSCIFFSRTFLISTSFLRSSIYSS